MSRRRTRVAGGPLLVVPLLVACGLGAEDGPERPPPETHTVEIRGMAFRPAELRVRAGDTIVWVNRDFVPHTATATDSAWTSPPLGQGEQWRRVALESEAGPYLCAFHPVMEARLVVDPSTQE